MRTGGGPYERDCRVKAPSEVRSSSGESGRKRDRAPRLVALLLGVAIAVVAIAMFATGRGLMPAGMAGGRTAGGVACVVPLDHCDPGGLGTRAEHCAHHRPARSARGTCLAPGSMRAAGRVRRRELGAAPGRSGGSEVRAVARVAQSALLRPVPATITAGRLASRYVSAAAEARVGGDLLEVVPGPGHPRWLIGDTRGKGLPAVRLASVAMTSFRDACAQPGLSLPEIARAVDRSVTRAAGTRTSSPQCSRSSTRMAGFS